MSQAETQGRGSHEPEAEEPEELEAQEPEAPPELEQRLQAMEAARPDEALTPRELAQGWPLGAQAGEAGAPEGPDAGCDGAAALNPPDAGAIEAVQLLAFEAGEPRWWLAMPARGDDGASGSETLGSKTLRAHDV